MNVELTEAIIELLRALLDDPLDRSGKWIYPGAVRLDASMPRIAVIQSGAVTRRTSLNATKVTDVYFDIYIYVKQGEVYEVCDDEQHCGTYGGGKLADYYADQIHDIMDNLPHNLAGVVDYPELVNSYMDYSLVEDKIVVKKLRYKIPYLDYPVEA